MSIKELPADTCHLLGSTTLIASPVSLVKELVDNAIDAGASTISVLVSPNTVDKVEVRDNGRGIDAADFDVLGRRGYTSRIQRFEDLKTVGGSSLGFRGEGVASANTLGYVAITTRTINEAVASTFRLTAGIGGIASDTHKLVSAPVGTTVAVTCLFSSLPVRRKVAVQEAAKTMAAIKTLLCGYAMARPHLRLSCKVMKGVVPEWHYSPLAGRSLTNGNISMKEAVLQLFGAEVARQCQEIVVSTDELLDGQTTLSQALSSAPDTRAGSFFFEACLPRPDADVSKLKLGGFVSVDGRPLSIHHQGIAEKLLIVFHTSFGRLLTELGSSQAKVKGVFMRLNIRCPTGTYDANVDSAKSDVLFADEKFLCDAFATFCAKTYTATAQTKYRQGGNALPSTPVRTQPALAFTGAVRGRNGLDQNGNQTPRQERFQDTDSSPVEGHAQDSFGDSELPGLISTDGLRQTTISFGGQNTEHSSEILGAARDSDTPTALASPEVRISSKSHRRSFISARDLHNQEQAAVRPPQSAEAAEILPATRSGDGYGEAIGAASIIQSTTPRSQTKAHRRPMYTIKIDRRQLRRSSAALARHAKAWDEEMDYLSPEMADITSIESRLRAAVVDWLARTKEGRKEKGEGALQVEFYLRKGLKKKALMLQDL